MLWAHQMEGVQRAIYASSCSRIKESLLNIVTGGGKTSIIGAVVAWLKYAHGVHKFLLFCPNTIVRDRLEDDFADAKVFRTFGFFPAGRGALHQRTWPACVGTRCGSARDSGQRRRARKHPAALPNAHHRKAKPRSDHESCGRAGDLQRRGAQHARGRIRQRAFTCCRSVETVSDSTQRRRQTALMARRQTQK